MTSQQLNWSEYRSVIIDVASALLDYGLKPGETIGILASNRVEHLIVDHAATHVRATPVTLYPTLTPAQFQHVLTDSNPRLLIVESEDLANKLNATAWFAEQNPPVVSLAAFSHGSSILWDSFVARGKSCRETLASELEERLAETDLADLATIIYTSGTTGPPKGVNITNRNVLWSADATVRAGMVDYEYSTVSYLPLAHVVERIWSIYLVAKTAGHVFCCPDPAGLLPSLQLHIPTFFMGVPRIWEKFADAVEAVIASPVFEGRREQIQRDRATLLHEWDLRAADQPVDTTLEMEGVRARRGLRDVRAMLGLERAWACSAAAALRPDTMKHFAGIGLTISQGYGLSETSGCVASEPTGSVSSGSIGIVMPDYEARIADDGEILVRGPGNTTGYRNLPEATAELIDSDGWLHTGDVGGIDDAGRIYVTDRKKDIIITAAGKNISPQAIETLVAGRSFIAQVVRSVRGGRTWSRSSRPMRYDCLCSPPSTAWMISPSINWSNTRQSSRRSPIR